MPSTVKSWPWGWIFAALLTVLCFLTAVTYVYVPKDPDTRSLAAQTSAQTSAQDMPDRALAAGAAQTASAAGVRHADDGRLWFKALMLATISCGAVWFAHAFTGDSGDRRQEQVTFAYFFMIGTFAVLMIPPFVKSQAIGSEPIGIVSGCVPDAEAVQLRCYPDKRAPVETNSDAAAGGETAAGTAGERGLPHNQWLMNIGGALREQDPQACKPSDPDDCKPGSSGNRVDVTGGVVVPLPFVIIALFGGAISLSRRLPEIQKRSEPEYVATAAEPRLGACEAREQMLFQIMQFVSAPLIAITAHQLIEPERQATAVGLAFLAGFGSESILLMIRGVANGLAPKNLPQPVAAVVPGAEGAAVAGPALERLAGAGTAPGIEGQAAPLQLTGTADADRAAQAIRIRLCIEDEGMEPGSLLLTVDGSPVGLLADGCAELELLPGQTYRIAARGRRAGQEVKGALAFTPSADDEGKPVQLELG